jgi:septal ring factor EnvC (AmiA/AmiB activator)
MRALGRYALTACLACAQSWGAQPESTLDEHAARLEGLRDRISVVDAEIDAARRQLGETRAELRAAELAISSASERLREVEQRIAGRMAELARLQALRNERSREVDEQRTALAQQIRAAYMMGRQDYLKLILNQEDPERVARLTAYHDFFSRARSHRIRKLSDGIAEIERLGRAIKLETNTLTRLRSEARREIDAIESRRAERSEVLAKLELEVKDRAHERERLVEDEQRLAALLGELEALIAAERPETGDRTTFAELRGKLSWPIDGRIVRPFGASREDVAFKSHGVLMEAPAGADVRAISHGRVVFADWFRNLGLLLIIDHGDGYMSLYGHNQVLYKEIGEWVEDREVIAGVGDTGGRVAAALYFEVRHNGVPNDPGEWCATPDPRG